MTDVLSAQNVSIFTGSVSVEDRIPLKVKRLTETAILPDFQSKGAACFDLHADMLSEGFKQVYFHGATVLRTGLAFDIPEGYALMVYSRSGHGFNKNMRLANCVGIIDSDYTGEVKVKLTVDTEEGIALKHGDRIAQAMLIPVPRLYIQEVTDLKVTERGANGFGSTGTGLYVVTAEEEAAAHPIMTSPHLK